MAQMRDSYTVLPPFARNEERLVSEALDRQVAPGAVIRGMTVRPLFLEVQKDEALTVQDVLSLVRVPPYNTNYTGGAWDVNSSARNSGEGWI